MCEKIIYGKKFYITEITNFNYFWAIARSEKVFTIPEDDFALFRIEGREHGKNKYCQKIYLFTTSFISGIMSLRMHERSFYLGLKDKSCKSSISTFSRNHGIDRVLLVKISPDLKEWYVPKVSEIKKEIKELFIYK